MPTDKLAIVINANARKVDPRTKIKIERHLPLKRIEIFESASVKQAEEIYQEIADKEFGCVLPYGGDGSIMAALNLLIQKGNGALPTFILQKGGTGNALPPVVGAKRGFSQLERIASAGSFSKLPTIKIPLLEVYLDEHSEPTYTFNAGKGLEAEVMKTYEAGKREANGRLGYVSAIAAVIHQNWDKKYAITEVICNGGRVLQASGKHDLINARNLKPGETIYEGPAANISVGATPFFGYGFKALPLANAGAIDREGLMHLRICTHPTQKQLLKDIAQPVHAWQLFKGVYRSQSIIELLAQDITVEMEGAAQIAGDVLFPDPAKIRAVYSKIKLIAVDLSRI